MTAFDVSGKPGETIRVAARTADGVRRLILLGVGDGRPADLRRAGAALARQVEAGATALAALPVGTDPDPFVEGVLLGGYKFSLRASAEVGQPARCGCWAAPSPPASCCTGWPPRPPSAQARLTAAIRPSPTGTNSGISRSSARSTSATSRAWGESGAPQPGGGGDLDVGRFRGLQARQVRGDHHVVEGHDAAHPEQPERGLQVVRVLARVRVTEHQVVGAVGQPGQHVQGPAQDQPVAVGHEPGLGERLAGHPLALGLHVHAGQHAVRPHAAEQPDAGGATAGADLHHGAGVDGRGQEPQGGPAGRPDRLAAAQVLGAGPGLEQWFVLGQISVRIAEGRVYARDDFLPGQKTDAQGA